MAQENQYKRNTGYKFRIGDILIGKPITSEVNGNERFSFLELGDKKVMRVNIVGNIVDRYDSSDEKKYLFLTLDDGSGQIKLKTFGDDSEKFKEVSQGQTVVVIGVLRYWNNEIYVAPEIIKEVDPKYLLLRKLETEGNRVHQPNPSTEPSEENSVVAIKDRIMDLVKSAEEQGGIELENLIGQLRDFSPTSINQEIQKLLEEGIIFEPRPGKIRYLG